MGFEGKQKGPCAGFLSEHCAWVHVQEATLFYAVATPEWSTPQGRVQTAAGGAAGDSANGTDKMLLSRLPHCQIAAGASLLFQI